MTKLKSVLNLTQQKCDVWVGPVSKENMCEDALKECVMPEKPLFHNVNPNTSVHGS